MQPWIGALVLSFVVGACGGKVGSSDDGAIVGMSSGGSTNDGGGTAGTSGATGGFSASTGGASATRSCMNAPVTFIVLPPPLALTRWCLGKPVGCQSVTGGIRDASGWLSLSNLCGTNCETCDREICHSIICPGPLPLTDEGATSTWNGVYYTTGTCGASATQCGSVACAAPGQYGTEVCGYEDPDPGSALGCEKATPSTPVTCVQVLFDYPSSGPVVVLMPGG